MLNPAEVAASRIWPSNAPASPVPTAMPSWSPSSIYICEELRPSRRGPPARGLADASGFDLSVLTSVATSGFGVASPSLST